MVRLARPYDEQLSLEVRQRDACTLGEVMATRQGRNQGVAAYRDGSQLRWQRDVVDESDLELIGHERLDLLGCRQLLNVDVHLGKSRSIREHSVGQEVAAADIAKPTLSCPISPLPARATRRPASSVRSTIARASDRRSAPASVSFTQRRVLRKSGVPSVRSQRADLVAQRGLRDVEPRPPRA
jgi:hypothetical protein